ncbi:probable pectinesterase/pectinesterase inhibitor 17 [Rhododendron vialii]|uniref:probable pectinesterase/pectinesterase inhibitor 17 n=1 Tax=Rhododendron vialii TaxID=182163 RepID=UPI00265FDA44|nr:probable pectinesterase/pectinesterase inhibitor 17 [Rhododendron vialii]
MHSFIRIVGVYGDGFMASHLTLKNIAVIVDKYAVAVDSASSFSVFYRCEFKAQKGALLARGYYQLYRKCKIQGASDLVFGNAHTILQRDAIYSNASLYWGVPLGPFAKIVIMQSLLEVRGTWSYAPYTPSTVFYGQHNNSRPGAVDGIMSPYVNTLERNQASEYTVRDFLNGETWLSPDMPHDLDLL